MAINLIKINEFPESVDTKNWMVVADAAGVSYKISIDNVKAELGIGALMQYRGSVVPASAVQPAGDFFVTATEAGPYTNYGGVVVPANSFAVISRVGGVYTSSITELDMNTVLKTDIVNDLTTGGALKVLSAEMGKTLQLNKLDSSLFNSIIKPYTLISYVLQNGEFTGSGSNAGFNASTSWLTTEALPTTAGEEIFITGHNLDVFTSKRFVFFKSTNLLDFVSFPSTTNNLSAITPAGYDRYTVSVSTGSTIDPLSNPYIATFKITKDAPYLLIKAESIEPLINKVSFSDNLKPNNGIIRGFYVNGTTGNIAPNSQYGYFTVNVLGATELYANSESKPLSNPASAYATGARHICFKDKLGNVLSGGYIDFVINADVPYGAATATISFDINSLNTAVVRTNNKAVLLTDKIINETKILRFVAYGDSTTQGADLVTPEDERWTTLLETALNIQIPNLGISGTRAEEIAMRMGGATAHVTFADGIISSTASYLVTFLDINPYRVGGTNVPTFNVYLRRANGDLIKGRLYSTGRFISFTTNISVDPTEIFELISASGKAHWDYFNFIGFGVNNEGLIDAGTQTIDYLKQMYSQTTSNLTDYAVWGLLDRGIGEKAGTPNGDIIIEMERWLEQKYGNRFFKVRQFLSSNYALQAALIFNPSFTPSAGDLDCVANNVTPPSFRSSTYSVHLNALGHQLQALFFRKQLGYLYNITNP